MTCNRCAMFDRPMPLPCSLFSTNVKPTPVSATVISRLPRARRALTSMRPPFSAGSMPCLMAFSAYVMTSAGGTEHDSTSGAAVTENDSRSPMRVCMIARYAATCWNSCLRGQCRPASTELTFVKIASGSRSASLHPVRLSAQVAARRLMC